MYGATINTLNVYTEGEGVPKSLLFTKFGSQGDVWYNEELDIPAMTNLKVFCATLDCYNSEVQSLAHKLYFLSDYQNVTSARKVERYQSGNQKL